MVADAVAAAAAVAEGSQMSERTAIGIGWRPEIAWCIQQRKDLEFVEIVFENWMRKDLPAPLLDLRSREIDIIPHAISLSLGGADRPDVDKLRKLDAMAKQLHAPFVSDHIAFVRAGGKESGHLLPVPRTEKALKVVIENVSIAREHLSVPLALENIAMLCDWKNSEMDEAEFLSRILNATDSLLLLDVANLYANSLNHKFDAIDFLHRLPLDRIAYVHVAGGQTCDGVYHDTHAHGVPQGVYDLLGELNAMTNLPRVMLERDDSFPDGSAINKELDAIASVLSVESKSPGTGSCGTTNRNRVGAREVRPSQGSIQ